MSIEQAFVEISPEIDTGAFVQSIDQAMSEVESRADDAVGSLESSFDSGAEQAAASLDEVTSDFDGAVSGADAAAEAVESAFSEAAELSEESLGAVDGDGFTAAVTGAGEAGDEVTAAFEGAADAASGALSETDADFSGIASDAETAGDEVAAAFEGAAEAASGSLEDVDADFSAVVDEAEDAASNAADAFSGVADDIDAELSSAGDAGAESFSGISADAESSASASGGAFVGVGATISGEFDEAEDGASSLEGSIRNLLVTVAGFAALREAVTQVEALKTEMGLLELQLDNLDVNLGTTVEQLGRFAESASIEFGINVDEIVAAERRIAQFAESSGQSFDDLLDTSINLSAVMGVSVPDAARILGQAMEEPDRAFTRLERRGVFLDSQQRTLIETLAESGDMAAASATFFDTLSSQVDGAAGVAADSSVRIGQAFLSAVREIGGPVSDTLDENVDRIISIIESVEPAASNLGQAAGIGLQVFVELGPAIETVASIIGNIPPELIATAAGMAAAQRATRGFNAALNLLRAHPAIAALSAVAAGLSLVTSLGSETQAEIHEVDRALQQIADSGGAAADELMSRLDERIQDVDESMSFLFIRATDDPFSAFVDQGGNLETVLGDINDGIVRLASTDLEAAETAFAAVQERVAGAGDEVQQIADEQLAEAEFALEQARAKAEETSEAIAQFGQSTQEAGRALDEFDVSRSGQDFLDFAEILNESESRADDMAAAAQRLGVSVETLENAVPGVQRGFEEFTGTLESSIPGVSDVVSRAFENMTAEHDHFFSSLDDLEAGSGEWVTRVQAMAGEDENFRAALERMQGEHDSLKEALQDPELADDFVAEIQRMDEAGGELDLRHVSEAIFGVEQDARQFVDNMQVIVDEGFTGLAQIAAESPEIAQVIADNIDDEEALGEMESGMQAINELTRNAMLEMAAEQALVSHAVGQAMRTGTLEPLNLLPDDIREQVLPTVEEAIRSGQESAGQAGADVGDSGAGGFIDSFLSRVQTNTPNLVETATGAVGSTIAPSSMTAQQGGSQVGSTLMGAEQSAILQGQPGVQNQMTGATQAVISSGEQAASAASVIGLVVTAQFVEGITRGLPLVRVAATAMASSAVSSAASQATGGRQAGEILSAQLALGIARNGLTASRTAATVASAAVAAASRQTGGAYNVGLSIGFGIASGIRASLGAIISAAVAAVRSALAAARSAAGIASPAALFRDEIGLPITQGIAEGIDDGIDDVVAATRGVVQAAEDASMPVSRPSSSTDLAVRERPTRLDPETIRELAEAMPNTIVLASGSERALARMTRRGDIDLENLDPTWRRRDDGR